MQSTAQTTPPDSSFSPSAVRGSQFCSRHHSFRAAPHETSSALPHRSVVDRITTIVLPSEAQRSVLSPPRVVEKQTQSNMRGSPYFSKMSSTLCTDSSTTGWGATLVTTDSVSGTWTPQEAEESPCPDPQSFDTKALKMDLLRFKVNPQQNTRSVLGSSAVNKMGRRLTASRKVYSGIATS